MPQPGNPQSLNRYTYSRNSPVTYSDPTGHAADQDTGYFPPLDIKKQTPAEARMAGDYCVVRMLLNRMENPTYLEWAERQAQITPREDQERWEPIYHALATADDSLMQIGVGAPSLLLIGSPRNGPVGSRVGANTELAAIRTQEHHIATNKNSKAGAKWTEKFRELFDYAGLSLDDPVNKLDLPADIHKGPHSQQYHQWLYDRLTRATAGAESPADFRAALVSELGAIADDLWANPSLIDMGR